MRHIVAVAVLLLVPSIATAQSGELSLYHQVVSIEKAEYPPREHLTVVEGWRSLGEDEKFGGWLFAAKVPLYLSFVMGPYFAPTDNFEIGVGFGAESEAEDRSTQYEATWRAAGYARLGPVNFYYENGGSNSAWYEADVTSSVGNVFLGLFGQTDAGIGPRGGIDIPIKSFKLNIWGAPLLYEKVEGEWLKRSIAAASLTWSK